MRLCDAGPAEDPAGKGRVGPDYGGGQLQDGTGYREAAARAAELERLNRDLARELGDCEEMHRMQAERGGRCTACRQREGGDAPHTGSPLPSPRPYPPAGRH
jgi:hypothetical protein